MGFSRRKQTTAAWPPFAASIKMLELSCGKKIQENKIPLNQMNAAYMYKEGIQMYHLTS